MSESTTTAGRWRPLDVDGDVERLAVMWNDSDDQWPGTFTGGVPMTAARVRDRIEAQTPLEILVYDDGDAIGGFCSVWRDNDDPSAAWIALLNVAPAYQGKGIARDVLTHWVRRAVELGLSRVDLGTWGGNLKAVPLYKKTGFFWRPGRWPHMMNFMPLVLREPLTRPFFDRHDWYATFERELEQAPDDERHEGMKVFTYRFAAGEERVCLWADQQSRGLTAIETDRVSVAAIAEQIEPARGLATDMRWQITNKGDRPMAVSLVAIGDQYLSIEHRESIVVEPGSTHQTRASVAVAADVPDAAVHQAAPAPAVRTVLVIDGDVTELRTGMRPVRPLELSLHPPGVPLTPGVAVPVTIQVRNRLPEAVEADVSLSLPDGLRSTVDTARIAVDAQGFAGFPVELTADERGPMTLGLSAAFDSNGRAVQTPAEPIGLIARLPGDVTAVRTRMGVRMENDELIVSVATRGAEVIFSSVPGRRRAGMESGNPAPPEESSEFDPMDWDLQIEHEPGRVAVVATAASKEHPGFSVTKRIELGSAGIATITYRFDNDAAVGRAFKLAQWAGASSGLGTVTLPIDGRLVQGEATDFPGQMDEVTKRADRYDEDWMAKTTAHITFGVVWSRDTTAEIDTAGAMYRLSTLTTLPPRSRTTLDPLYVVVGTAGFEPVRELWRRLHGIHVPLGEHDPDPRAWLEAVPQRPVLTIGGEADATIVVRNETSRVLDGELVVTTPDGWEVDRQRVPLGGVRHDAPAQVPLHLKTTAPLGAARATIEVRSEEIDERFDLALIRLGDDGAVRVTELERDGRPVVTMDNGALVAEVYPDFAATLGSLREGDVEWVHSPFPTPRAFAWQNEWHGGLGPELTVGDTAVKLHRETATTSIITDELYGVAWQGVRVRLDLKEEEDARGLSLEFDVLTVGGSPVVRTVTRVINQTSAVRLVQMPLAGHFLPAAGLLVGPDGSLKTGDRTRGIGPARWGALQDPDSGRCVGIVSPNPDVTILRYTADGGIVWVARGAEVPPDGLVERVCYVAVGDRDEIPLFGALTDL